MEVAKAYKMQADAVGGVAFDGGSVWLSMVDGGRWSLSRIDRKTGAVERQVEREGKVAGMAWDGANLWGITDTGIACFDPETLETRRLLPLPDEGFISGLAWDGEALWCGAYHQKKIYKLDPETGKVLRTLATDRFVTGVAWADDDLWHAVDGEDDAARPTEIRRLDQGTGAVLDRFEVPYVVSGMSHDGESFWCGDCELGMLRQVKEPS